MPKLVAFVEVDDRARTIVTDVARRLIQCGESLEVLADLEFDDSVPHHSLRNNRGEYLDEQQIRDLIRSRPNRDRVFFVVGPAMPREKLLRLIELCDAWYFVAHPSEATAAVESLNQIAERLPDSSQKGQLVWALGTDQSVAPRGFRPEGVVKRDFKIPCLPSDGPRLYRQGIERLVHHLRGVNIGIALSGGAARGMAHLGVLRALDEAGVTVDTVAGTSAGVLTGLTYCAGISPEDAIEAFTKELAPGGIYKALPKGDEAYLVAQFRWQTWDAMLRKYVYDWHLEQLPIPLHSITTDLLRGESVVRSTGDGVHALLESINLPVISTPICRDGMLLVDGGVLNNLPTSELVKRGCNLVIGVDVSAHLAPQVGKNTLDTPPDELVPPNAIGNILRCLNVQAHAFSEAGARYADLIIEPDVSRFGSAAFTKTPEIADVGYHAAQEAVPRILQCITQVDSKLTGQQGAA